MKVSMNGIMFLYINEDGVVSKLPYEITFNLNVQPRGCYIVPEQILFFALSSYPSTPNSRTLYILLYKYMTRQALRKYSNRKKAQPEKKFQPSAHKNEKNLNIINIHFWEMIISDKIRTKVIRRKYIIPNTCNNTDEAYTADLLV